MSYFTPEILDAIIRRFRIKPVPEVFIETGTYKGISLANVSQRFRQMHTIELSQELYQAARQRFHDQKHIKCYQGDSAGVLARLLPQIKEPAFFWLDAHYSGGVTARGAEDVPIFRELEAIFAAKRNYRDVIIIDDILLMGKKEVIMNQEDPNYPSVYPYDWRDITVDKILALLKKEPRSYYAEDFYGMLVVLSNRAQFPLYAAKGKRQLKNSLRRLLKRLHLLA